MFKVVLLACLLVLSIEAQFTRSENKIPKDSENDVFLQNETRREFYVFPAYLRGKFGKRKVGYLVFSNMDITKPRFLSLQDKRFREGLEIIKSPGIYRGKSAEKAFSRLFASKFYRKPSFNIRQGIIRPKSVEKLSPQKAKLEEEKIAVVKSISRGESRNIERNESERESSVLEVDPNVELTVFDSGSEDSIIEKADREALSTISNSNNNDRSINVILTKNNIQVGSVNKTAETQNKSAQKSIISEVKSQIKEKTNSTNNKDKMVPVSDIKREMNPSLSQMKVDLGDVIVNSQGMGKSIHQDKNVTNKLHMISQTTGKEVLIEEISSKKLNNMPITTKETNSSSLIDARQHVENSNAAKTDQIETTTDSLLNPNPFIISKGMLVGKRVDKNVPFSSVLNLGNYVYFTGQNNSNVNRPTQNKIPQLPENRKDFSSSTNVSFRSSPFSKSNGLLVLNKGNHSNTQSQLRTYIIRFDKNDSKGNNQEGGANTSRRAQTPAAIIVSFSDVFDSGLAEGLSKTINVSLVEDINPGNTNIMKRENIAKLLSNIPLNKDRINHNNNSDGIQSSSNINTKQISSINIRN